MTRASRRRRRLPAGATTDLDAAAALTRTGDLWLFRGSSGPDRVIRMVTNAPVNHVGVAVVLDDLPPLLWHAELGKGLPDVWTSEHQRGVQLHDLRQAVVQWHDRYAQDAWLRQLDPGPAGVTRAMEDEVLRVIDSMQLTAKHRVATPVNWKHGQDVIIAGSVTDDEAKRAMLALR